MISDEQFIPLIHNYCDRWCERCGFTARCSVFAMEAEMSDAEKGISNDAIVRNLQNILSDAQRMLEEKAEEFGIDLNPDPDDFAAYLEKSERIQDQIDASDLSQTADEYAFGIRQVLDESENDWFGTSEIDSGILQDVLAVIRWYQFFIAVKIKRGLHGILNEDGLEDGQEIVDTQSDANGSIKVALIGIERSILAWTYVLNENNVEVVRPIIEILESIKQKTEHKFPYARDFVRPGFDEIETVM